MNRIIDDNRKELYETTELTHKEIAALCDTTETAISNWIRRNYTKDYRKKRNYPIASRRTSGKCNPMFGKKGKQHPRYKTGNFIDDKGYKLVLKPKWFTGRPKSNYVFEHHIVYCELNNMTEIPRGFHIHHIDHNPLNNNIDNLVMLSASDHIKLHNKLNYGVE